MNRLFILLLPTIFLFVVACAPTAKQPKVTWYVDPAKIPWVQYILDKEVCQNYANAAFPVDLGEIRKQPYFYYRAKCNQTCYLNCMHQKGHDVYCITEK